MLLYIYILCFGRHNILLIRISAERYIYWKLLPLIRRTILIHIKYKLLGRHLQSTHFSIYLCLLIKPIPMSTQYPVLENEQFVTLRICFLTHFWLNSRIQDYLHSYPFLSRFLCSLFSALRKSPYNAVYMPMVATKLTYNETKSPVKSFIPCLIELTVRKYV